MKVSHGRKAVIAVACALLILSLKLRASKPAEPQAVIYEMFDAARAGDTKRYLASFAGPLQASLRHSLTDSGDSGFAKYLSDTCAGVKGLAVSDPPESPDLQEMSARVEYIYEDRNQTQTLYLKRTNDGWKITGVDADQQLKALIRYGTPIR